MQSSKLLTPSFIALYYPAILSQDIPPNDLIFFIFHYLLYNFSTDLTIIQSIILELLNFLEVT